MWQLANFFKKHGIASFDGKQVEVGEDWMQKWLGKMPDEVADASRCSAPTTSSRARQGLYETATQVRPILPIIFETPPPLKKGYFGRTTSARTGNCVAMRHGNWLPTPTRALPGSARRFLHANGRLPTTMVADEMRPFLLGRVGRPDRLRPRVGRRVDQPLSVPEPRAGRRRKSAATPT